MRALAKELGPQGIRVNAVCPGWVRTRAALRSLEALSARAGMTEEAMLEDILAAQALPGLMDARRRDRRLSVPRLGARGERDRAGVPRRPRRGDGVTGSLDGKRALVTGGASGIGRAIALAFAAEGAHVAVNDRAPEAEIEAVVAEIHARGGCAFAVRADVADEARGGWQCSSIALARLGGLDVLVNNAGILIEKPLLETTAADFDRLIGVNLRGAFLVGREALRVMARRGEGRVINLASELAYLGRANCSVYCASKGGVLSMTRSWAREFAPNILVNAIAPGPTDTAMLTGGSTSPETLAKEAQIPLASARPSRGDRERRRVPGRAGRDVHDRAMPQPERRRGDVLRRRTRRR